MTPFDLETKLDSRGITAHVVSDTFVGSFHFFKFFVCGNHKVTEILRTLKSLNAENATWHGNSEFHCLFPI